MDGAVVAGVLQWDWDSIVAISVGAIGAISAAASKIGRRGTMRNLDIGFDITSVRKAATSSRTMLILAERVKDVWRVTIESESTDEDTPSIAKFWRRRDPGRDYIKEIIEPIIESRLVWIQTSELAEDSVLRDIYIRDGTMSSMLLRVGVSKNMVRFISINRTTAEPMEPGDRATIKDLTQAIVKAHEGPL